MSADAPLTDKTTDALVAEHGPVVACWKVDEVLAVFQFADGSKFLRRVPPCFMPKPEFRRQ